MVRYSLFLILVLLSIGSYGQNFYWVAFTDKNNSEFSLSEPEDYLSQRAIERRQRQNIPIDSLDLPVNKTYIDSVLTLDVEFVHASKWLNGITVKTNAETVEAVLADWSFVDYLQLTKPSSTKSARVDGAEGKFTDEITIDTSYYGESVHQVGMLNGQFLHLKDYRGKGMQIAVLDAGFLDANKLAAFDSLWADGRILGERDFVNPESDIFAEHYHGMSVLSCMGGNVPGELVGTAPDASYWLLRSEDAATEYIIEEDNWIAAAEFADSLGVDVINSSLGYFTFDDSNTDHTYSDMDGKTTRVTQGANIAASRGILVFASAGNERNKDWFRIIAPSDGEKVIGVGAVTQSLTPAAFTSAGPAFGGAVKPNVSAMGYAATVQHPTYGIWKMNGTSFSSPVLAGMVTCLWQMFPNKTAEEIKLAVEMSANKYNNPDSLIGYGIPDMQIAAELLGYQEVNLQELGSNWKAWPNPFVTKIVVETSENIAGSIHFKLISMAGHELKSWELKSARRFELSDLPELNQGIYFLRIESEDASHSIKLSSVGQ